MMTCINCDHKGNDVGFHLDYVGGQGIVRVGPECNDRVACWARWDRKHGLKDTIKLGGKHGTD